MEKSQQGPKACDGEMSCKTLVVPDGSRRCLDLDGELVPEKEGCTPLLFIGSSVQIAASPGNCLDTWSDEDPGETLLSDFVRGKAHGS